MEVTDFAVIEAEFLQRVHSVVWCNAATVDSQQRPRSRILHPIWEGSTGWVLTYRDSHKARHLAANPYISLAYIADISKPVYIDCQTEWADSLMQKQHVWDLFLHAPPPLGYDPATLFDRVDHERLGVLKLIPWRIELVTFPAPSLDANPVWRRQLKKA
ncbi:MAG: pyridoxamine 5'-phosphate oxidase family protein [Chloroflexaceae bacterium]|nr:pyridoxamine 5'-phosphate oxidase family protein [Chloroflexaceae bacterium]